MKDCSERTGLWIRTQPLNSFSVLAISLLILIPSTTSICFLTSWVLFLHLLYYNIVWVQISIIILRYHGMFEDWQLKASNYRSGGVAVACASETSDNMGLNNIWVHPVIWVTRSELSSKEWQRLHKLAAKVVSRDDNKKWLAPLTRHLFCRQEQIGKIIWLRWKPESNGLYRSGDGQSGASMARIKSRDQQTRH